jgi:hypothetical protein
MSNETFVQQRAYIYAPSLEEIKKMKNELRGEDEILITEEDDGTSGVVIIDILGE